MIRVIREETPELFEGVFWATSAVSPKKNKGLEHLKIETNSKGAKYIGCDGHRLHIYKHEANNIEPGTYVIGHRSFDEITLELFDMALYPEYRSTIPSPSNVTKSTIFNTADNLEDLSYIYSSMTREIGKNYSINYLFLKQLTDIPMEEFKIMLCGNLTPPKFILKKKGYFGILMPVLNEDDTEWDFDK